MWNVTFPLCTLFLILHIINSFIYVNNKGFAMFFFTNGGAVAALHLFLFLGNKSVSLDSKFLSPRSSIFFVSGTHSSPESLPSAALLSWCAEEGIRCYSKRSGEDSSGYNGTWGHSFVLRNDQNHIRNRIAVKYRDHKRNKTCRSTWWKWLVSFSSV